MEEVRSWRWEEMTVVLVGPAAGLEENVRGGLKPQSLLSGQSNQNKGTLAKLEGEGPWEDTSPGSVWAGG